MSGIIIILLCLITLGLIAEVYMQCDEVEKLTRVMEHYRNLYHQTEEDFLEYRRNVSKMIEERKEIKNE